MIAMQLTWTLGTQLFFFAFTLWLGAYLIARNSQKMVLRLAGLGLVCYALTLASVILWNDAPILLTLLPSLLWIGALLHLLPDDVTNRNLLISIWAIAALPVMILVTLNVWFALLIVIAMLGCVGLIMFSAVRSRFKNTLAVLALTALFFSLSTGLLIVPLNWFARDWTLFLLGIDLIVLGLVISLWDAFDEGEELRWHIARSLVSSFYYAGALGVMVIIAAAVDGGVTFGTLLLFIGVIVFGIITQTFADAVQWLMDRTAFARGSAMSAQREYLREVIDVLPRLPTLDPATLDEVEFARLTRRAISALGDLPKLAASPLTNLALVVKRSDGSPLDKAQALKMILSESIERLKPQGKGDFGTGDEWRYYNALYFPYVRGLKPYTRRSDLDALDDTSRQALEWFRVSVPERTLHNWQNAAAKLVAEDLRSRQ
jgi:hypothetical protein